jgi:serine/threonine protein kinase
MTPGNIIGGRYRLVRQLGEGAMGVVWAAVNQLTSGEVALKLILQSTEELRLRLLREARVCGGLKHRNVIEVHDVGQTEDGDPFLVMQLLYGETLAELLKRQRRLDPPVAAQIARDVARALAAAHAAGVIHRDLKPANIFLHHEAGADGATVKVLDFGVSKSLAMSDGLVTIDGGAIGSPAYMSPEQARADRDLDHRADIWSLGVVLFELLTGVRPFQGDTNQVIPRIILGDIPLVSRYVRLVDPGLVTLVSRCLERDRAHRIGSATELAELLQRHMSPTPSNPDEGAATYISSPPMEWDEESDASEELTIAIEAKDLPPRTPWRVGSPAPFQEMARSEPREWIPSLPAPRVEPRSNLAPPGSNAHGEAAPQDPCWWRVGPSGGAPTAAAVGVAMPFPARVDAVAPFSVAPAQGGDPNRRTDLGTGVATVPPRPRSTVRLPAPAEVTPVSALDTGRDAPALEQPRFSRKALVAIAAGSVMLLALGVGAYRAVGEPLVKPAEPTRQESANPAEGKPEIAPPKVQPTVPVEPPLPAPVKSAVPPPPPVANPSSGQKLLQPAGKKEKSKALVNTPSKGPRSWLN